jgi:hypothetical protein
LAYYGKIPPDPDRSWIELELLYDMLLKVKKEEKEQAEKDIDGKK